MMSQVNKYLSERGGLADHAETLSDALADLLIVILQSTTPRGDVEYAIRQIRRAQTEIDKRFAE